MEFQPAHLFPADIALSEDQLVPEGLGSYIRNYLTPPQIATAYNVPKATGLGVNIGIFSFGGGFLQSDYNKSFTDLQSAGLINPSLTPQTVRQVLLDGQTGTFSTTTSASSENTVDIYCAGGMAPEASITIYIGSYITSMIAAAIADGMHIVSMSWGRSETTAYEPYLAQLSAAKITFLASSGDYGSVLSTSSNSIGLLYPASSPYAISAGGTKLTLTSSDTRSTETDDNRDSNFPTGWGGGGGISTLFSLPSFQSGLTYTPITGGVTGSPTALTTRGSPDFSAPMNTYVYYKNGAINGTGGTSLACPILAGILARNLQLTGTARSSTEWNTIAYANTGAFYDITVGTNNTVITNGYAGTNSWDAVTGLGPPIVSALYKATRTGSVFPKQNYDFRSTGLMYPRINNNTRRLSNNYVIPFTGTTMSSYATSAQLGGRLSGGSVAVNTYCTWTFSATNIVLKASGIPFHSFYNSAAANVPYVQNFNYTWTYRGGTNTSGTQATLSGGRVGFWLNGVSLYNPSAQFGAPGGYPSYTNWHYNAAFEEGVEASYSFGEDDGGGHASPTGIGNGTYHYHDGSMIVTGAWALGVGHTSGAYGTTGLPEVSVIPYYNGNLNHPDGHSKIMGISADGFPIYGPYGYSTATNALSSVRRMVTGYALNPTFVSNNARTTNGTTPAVNSQYPLGIFVEDWSYVGGGDLDTHNGRYCVTPDYPSGTYAYFLAFNSSMKPTYPYVIGNTYYGTAATI
jgi:hypothetical protein